MLPVLLAQTADDISATVDLSALADAEQAAAVATTGAAAVGIGLIIFWIFAVVVGLVFLIWWIVLLIDLTKRDFPQKNTWLILMILGLVFGFVIIIDIVYYFAVVKQNLGAKAS
jgi:hypothetical protein